MITEGDHLDPVAVAARAAERQRREQEVARSRQRKQDLAEAQRALHLPDAAESFECDECGRWTEAYDAWLSYLPSVKRMGITAAQFEAIRAEASMTPLRPAFMQRQFRKTYEQAVSTLDLAERLGLLRTKGRGLAPAPPLCGPCYTTKLAAVNKPQPPVQVPTGREPIPPRLRFLVLQRDNFRCTYCGRAARDGAVLHVDHVIPVAAGGLTTEENLVAACDTCNFGKSAAGVLAE
jgi:hypothetical protein